MGDGHLTIQHKDFANSPANHLFISDGKNILNQLNELNIPGKIIPRVSLQILASTANNAIGAGIQGINVDIDPYRKLLIDKVQQGDWLEKSDMRGVLIGSSMARKLKVKIGSKIVFTSVLKNGNTEAQLGKVKGIFNTGLEELDSFLIISNINFTQPFLVAEGNHSLSQPLSKVAIFLDDEYSQKEWKKVFESTIKQDNIAILEWQDIMPQLVQYIVLDDVSAYVMQVFILLVILFGIINTILMSVLERTREFGLLRALGMQKHYLLALLILETFLLSILAVLFGWIIGGSIHWYVASFGIDFSGMIPEGTTFAGTFMDPIIYSELSMNRVIQLTTIVFLATLLSGIYPAIKATRITPIEALRT